MSNWTSEITVTDELVVCKVAGQGMNRKMWIAELTDTDSEYQFDREFICYSDVDGDADSGHLSLEDGTVLEYADGDSRLYWYVDLSREKDRLRRIDADEAESALTD